MKINALCKSWLGVSSLTFGILVLLGMLYAPAANAAQKKPLLFGISQDITGFNADGGRAERDAIIMAIEEWNEKGGVQGQKIEYIVRDNAGDPTKATSIAKEFVAKGIFALLGGTSSTVGIPENKVMAENQILSLGGAGAVENFSKAKDGKWWYWAGCTAVPEQALVPLVYFSQKGYKKITYIISSAAWPKNLRDVATAKIKEHYGPKYGMNVVADIEVDVKAKDIVPQVAKLKEIAPEVIYAILYPDNAKAFYTAAAALNWLPVAPTTQFWGLMESVYLSGDPKTMWGTLAYSTTHEEKPAFVEKKKKFTDKFKYVPVGHFSFAYDDANLLCTAIDKVGADKFKVRDWLATKAKGTPVISGKPGATADFTEATYHSLLAKEDFAWVYINQKGEREWLK